MNIRVLAPVAAVLLVAACSNGSAADDASAGASDLHGGTVCEPLDYPHVLANADYYRQFDSDAAAGGYLTAIIAQGQLAANSGPNAKLKEITQDARLLALVSDVYKGFEKVFPAYTAGLPTPPRVAIVESDIVNAFALGPGFTEDPSRRKDQSPWLFIVHTALMNRGGSDTELRGLFAHELGHLILRNYLANVRDAIRVSYLVKSSEDGLFGESQANDAVLGIHVEEMLKRQARVGGLPELGLPAIASLGTYAKVTDALLAAATPAGASPSDACAAAKAAETALQKAQGALVPGASAGNDVPATPTADQAAQLQTLSQSYDTALRACLDGAGVPANQASLMQLTAETNSLSDQAVDPNSPDHAKLVSLMLEAETATDEALPKASLVDRLLAAQTPIRAELIGLRGAPEYPIDDIRVYDYEEDADDAAVRILAAIGDDPMGIADFLLDAALTPEQKAACLADIGAHKRIPFGRFIDTHPATCWRVYHATGLAKAIAACPAAAATVAARPPLGSNAPSVVDKDPRELVEKGYGPGKR
jgi:hypothetical protein